MAPCISPSLSCSEIFSRGKDNPLSTISFILSQFGCLAEIGSKSEESLNSDPYAIGEKADDRMILSKSMSFFTQNFEIFLGCCFRQIEIERRCRRDTSGRDDGCYDIVHQFCVGRWDDAPFFAEWARRQV